MKESFTQSAIIEPEEKNAEGPGQKVRAFYFKLKGMKTLQTAAPDSKDFTVT